MASSRCGCEDAESVGRQDDSKLTMYTGDILFQDVTPENADAFNGNAVDYLGGEYDLQTDPIASPFFAEPRDFAGAVPPLYFAVGASESILGDSVRVAQHAAQGGTDVILEASKLHSGVVVSAAGLPRDVACASRRFKAYNIMQWPCYKHE